LCDGPSIDRERDPAGEVMPHLRESPIIGLGQLAELNGAIMQKIMEFPFVARIGALIAMLLFITFAFIPVIPFTMLGVAMTPEGLLMARRMAALFLGISLILWVLRDAPDSDLRRGISLALSVSMGVLAAFGFLDWLGGRNGPGVFVALAAEAYFAIVLGLNARGNKAMR
jgi:hypothetical protein